MPLALNIPEDTTRFLNERGQRQYCNAIEHYAEDLFKEASRLEATAKSTGGDPEITSTMVKDADLLLRRGWVRPHKKPILIFAQLIATVGGFLTGLLADMKSLNDATTLVLFLVLLVFTVTAAVVAIIKD